MEHEPLLFIDTSYESILALYDQGKVLSAVELGKIKSTDALHIEIHKILTDSQLKFSDIQSVLTIAGPGFYTGLRVAEGIGSTLTVLGKKHFSFYHYQWPYYLIDQKILKKPQKGNYVWVANGFKGQIFTATHPFDKEESCKLFHSFSDFKNYLSSQINQEFAIWTYNKEALGFVLDDLDSHEFVIHETQNQFIENLELIIKWQLQCQRHNPIYYFRHSDEEFKKV